MISLYLINAYNSLTAQKLEDWLAALERLNNSLGENSTGKDQTGEDANSSEVGELFIITCDAQVLRSLKRHKALKKVRPILLPKAVTESSIFAGYSVRLLSMWNHALRCAAGDINLIVNDLLTPPSNIHKLTNLKEDCLYIPRIVNPDGTRYLDWIRFGIPYQGTSGGHYQSVHENLFLADYTARPSIQAILPEALIATNKSLQKFRWRLKSDFFIFTHQDLTLQPLQTVQLSRSSDPTSPENLESTSIGDQVFLTNRFQEKNISHVISKISDNSTFYFSAKNCNQELQLALASSAKYHSKGKVRFKILFTSPDGAVKKYDINLKIPCYNESITLPMPTAGEYELFIKANYRDTFLYITKAIIKQAKVTATITDARCKHEPFLVRVAITTFASKPFPRNFDNQFLAILASRTNRYLTISNSAELLTKSYDILITTPDIFEIFRAQLQNLPIKVILFCEEAKSKFGSDNQILKNIYYGEKGTVVKYPLIPVRLLKKETVDYFVIGGNDQFQEKISNRLSSQAGQEFNSFCYDPRLDEDSSFTLPYVRCKRLLVNYLRKLDIGYIRNYQYHTSIEFSAGLVKRKKTLIPLSKAIDTTITEISKLANQQSAASYFYFDSELTFMQLDTKLFFDHFTSQFPKQHGPSFEWLVLLPEQLTSLLDSNLVNRIKKGIYICLGGQLNPMSEINIKEILPQFKRLEIKLITCGYEALARQLPYEVITYRPDYPPFAKNGATETRCDYAVVILVPSIKHYSHFLKTLDLHFMQTGETGMILCREECTGLSFTNFEVNYQGIDTAQAKQILRRSRLIVDLEVGQEPMAVRYAVSHGIYTLTIKPFNHPLVKSITNLHPSNLFAMVTTVGNEPIQI